MMTLCSLVNGHERSVSFMHKLSMSLASGKFVGYRSVGR